MDWKLMISRLVLINGEIYKVDKKGLWPYTLPKVAAAEEQLTEFQKKLGRTLPEEYLEFLRHANGWYGFHQETDLLSVDDFFNDKYDKSISLFFDSDEYYVEGIEKKDLLPIGVNPPNGDIFYLSLSNDEYFGNVIWYAGWEVERYSNFDEFFMAMIEYNRSEIDQFLEENKNGGGE
jgi:hypothetical protein